jgi:predicted amidohydrolase
MRVSVVQMGSGADKAHNIAEMLRLLEAAVSKDGTDLAVFPEMAFCLTGDNEVMKSNAESVDGALPRHHAGEHALPHEMLIDNRAVHPRNLAGSHLYSN